MPNVNTSPRCWRPPPTGCAALAWIILATGGCTRQPPSTFVQATPGPLPPPRAAHTEQAAAAPPPNEETPAARRLPPPAGNVAELEARYRSGSSTPEERDALVQALGRLAAPQALPALRRIFDEERRLDLRMRVLEVAGDLASETNAAGRWELFSRATEARQPVLMRLSAMQTLADSEDPRAVALYQSLARDANATIREKAARILKDRQP